ncbi:MAG TPA: formate--phosphoribosylaminoimidazolecarboxamide ligase [Nitrososphaerales archaeon]|nr:formate--phosphoribosylaminoimidazolecarboxamide ligase [Nitrososphaerota archaeon]PXF22947.1 MAG: 5-formaminoimidazole-4-carboxamide-1-(beta)-D-ribofuranosyl 5'-monophosphate synthetase [Nitrososphaerota archaeon]HIC83885.1 formate--phosphoribosylaminoimidazolecarboxamide ligase [Nitrososphaerales archaeon]HIM82920.1 formate--phosphoribosylaminoimidazolecarboxamide ligase [Nitrososphaerales archaeon]
MNSIATLGSHCALQVLKGAKEEGFNTVLVTKSSREKFYRRYDFIDEYIVVEDFQEIVHEDITNKLTETDSILIPHGTLISEVGIEKIEKLNVPIFGNRHILRWEADRDLKTKLMEKSGVSIPKTFNSPEEIDCLTISKLSGARGGSGYFLAKNSEDYYSNVDKFKKQGLMTDADELQIQEYIIGVPVYLQYFQSPLKNELELFGIDKRYETNVDSLGRIPSTEQNEIKLSPTYIVVGNLPLVLRESLLVEVYDIGENFVTASKELVPPGMPGPFCMEGVYDSNGKFIAFEFSARIVAGTNIFTAGSPYSYLTHGANMSMGRRIALEIKNGIDNNTLDDLLT